jgi:hypothetical protein
MPRAMSATENALALGALRRIPAHASLSDSLLRRVWLRPPERDEIFQGFHVGWTLVRGPTAPPVIAVAKILASPQEVWIDELAANGDGSALARWALLSALETALDARLTAAQATVRLQVALSSQPGTPSAAHGMYRSQLGLTDGTPAHEGPWQSHSPTPGHVLMHGIVGELVARLRAVLANHQLLPSTQLEGARAAVAVVGRAGAVAAQGAAADAAAGEVATSGAAGARAVAAAARAVARAARSGSRAVCSCAQHGASSHAIRKREAVGLHPRT